MPLVEFVLQNFHHKHNSRHRQERREQTEQFVDIPKLDFRFRRSGLKQFVRSELIENDFRSAELTRNHFLEEPCHDP